MFGNNPKNRLKEKEPEIQSQSYAVPDGAGSGETAV